MPFRWMCWNLECFHGHWGSKCWSVIQGQRGMPATLPLPYAMKGFFLGLVSFREFSAEFLQTFGKTLFANDPISELLRKGSSFRSRNLFGGVESMLTKFHGNLHGEVQMNFLAIFASKTIFQVWCPEIVANCSPTDSIFMGGGAHCKPLAHFCTSCPSHWTPPNGHTRQTGTIWQRMRLFY